jgi:hypothetical protein
MPRPSTASAERAVVPDTQAYHLHLLHVDNSDAKVQGSHSSQLRVRVEVHCAGIAWQRQGPCQRACLECPRAQHTGVADRCERLITCVHTSTDDRPIMGEQLDICSTCCLCACILSPLHHHGTRWHAEAHQAGRSHRSCSMRCWQHKLGLHAQWSDAYKTESTWQWQTWPCKESYRGCCHRRAETGCDANLTACCNGPVYQQLSRRRQSCRTG